jgi:hypothetical protein
MSKNKGQPPRQTSDDHLVHTPNGWAAPLAEYLNQLNKLRPRARAWLSGYLSRALHREAGCSGYAEWFSGGRGPPDNPTQEVEIAALEAILPCLKRNLDSVYEESELRPDHRKHLDELRSRAIRAVRDRQRQLGKGDGEQPTPLHLPEGYTGQELLTTSDLASLFGVDKDALRKRLERMRGESDRGWQEVRNRGQRKAHFVYQLETVWPIIRDLIASAKRPPKK